MNKKALRKDFYMEIRKSLGRFLSIFFIVAIGVAFFSGIRSAEPDMRASGDAYFDAQNLMDIQVMSTLGLTKEDKTALEKVDGIKKVEAGYSVDALCSVNESKKVVHITSILPSMNQVVAEKGRLPKKSDECLVDADFLDTSGYEIGDKITFTSGTSDPITDNLKQDTFTIVGSASSPCYIGFHRGSSTIGNGSISAFISVPKESFDMDVYTEMYALVDGAKELTAFTSEYTDKVDAVKDRVKKIKKTREEARYNDIVDEANDKLGDAQKELDDAKAEAMQKLDDAKAKLDDGQKQLDDAQNQINDSTVQLNDSIDQLNEKQAELDTSVAEINEQKAALNEKIVELNQVKEQYNQLLASQMATAEVLQGMYAQITAGDQSISEAKAQLDAADSQVYDGQEQINDGWDQLNQGKAELESAENEIAGKQQELDDAQVEYNDAKKEADTKIADGESKIQDAKDDISKIEHAKWYINDRDSLTEYTGYGENADRMRAIGKVFPVLFFLVAALISLTTMTRMVEEQRTQIGTLKALGYERHSIAAKYLGYACLATVSGSIFGVLVGEKILPYIIIVAYGIMYRHMNMIQIPYNLDYALMASVAALVCTLVATIFSCYKELREQAAELMRPPAPKQGKRVFMERITFIWKHLSFIWKATVRNLVRYKKRFFMTVFGIGGCMALLLVGFGLKDSIFDIALLQYDEIQLYDGSVILDEDASDEQKDETISTLAEYDRVDKTAENFLQQVTIGHGKTTYDVYLNVPQNVEKFKDFVSFHDRITKEEYKLDDNGVILAEKTAKMLGVKAGDSIYIKDDVQGEIKVKVEHICENYIGHYVYMTPTLYEKAYKEAPAYNSVYYVMKAGQINKLESVGEEILKQDGALSVTYTNDAKGQIDDMLGSLNIVLVVLVISAGMLAFVVLYNLNNINITERQRELATLKVLGFFDKEVSAYVYRENIILTIVGALVGMVMGRFLHQFVIVTVEIESAMFGRNIDFSSYIYSFLITMGFSVFVNIVMYFKLKRIDMVESLKSVE